MEKYFLYLVLVSLTGYTRGKPGPSKMMTCYECVKVLEGTLVSSSEFNKKKKCDADYSKSKSEAKEQTSVGPNCITLTKTEPGENGQDAKITYMFMHNLDCGALEGLGANKENCKACKEPRCNYPLKEATEADMIECYECEDKAVDSEGCNKESITKSTTTKQDGRIYSCYTITTYEGNDKTKVKDHDRFSAEKDLCEVFKKDIKYDGKDVDCKECSASLCNTDGYVATATEKPKINFEVSVGDEGIGIQIGTTTSPGKSSASKIVLKYFNVIYFALYCGQYKHNSFLRRLY